MTDGDERTLTVNATAVDVWVYLSLHDGALLSPVNPLQDDTWQLALQRYNLAVNGGVSGGSGSRRTLNPGPGCQWYGPLTGGSSPTAWSA